MPATIQKILKPTKYRAVDTSTSEQIVGEQLLEDPSFDVDVAQPSGNGVAVVGSHWQITDLDIEITGGKAVWTAYSGTGNRELKDRTDGPFLPVTDRYRVVIVVSDYTSGELMFNSGSYNTGYVINSAGTWTFDFSPKTGSGNFHIKASNNDGDGTEDAVLSVSEVSVYKLESFGSNNHGQIYSGRALEFDGVSDRFATTGGGIVGTPSADVSGVNYFADGNPWTMAVWLYVNGRQDAYIIGKDQGTRPHLYLNVQSSVQYLEFRANDAGSDFYRFGKLQENAWHRLVVTSNGTTISAYSNGVLIGTITDGMASIDSSGSFTTTEMWFTGWGTPYESSSEYKHGLDGMMSDAQVWDVEWTESDITFDYLNPESLVLNNGGTLLTESNLKLWYSMQDGHRGQQSHILDGSGTGLGPELISNISASAWTKGFAAGGSHIDETTTITDNADGSVTFETAEPTDFQTASVPFVNENGVTYKISITGETLEETNGDTLDNFYWRVGGSVADGHNTANSNMSFRMNEGAHTETNYFKSDVSTGTAYLICMFKKAADIAHKFRLDSVSIKAINQKHHATTVFMGDNLYTAANAMRVAADGTTADETDATTGWSSNGTSTFTTSSTSHSGSKSIVYEANVNHGGISTDLQPYLTVGRTYKLSLFVRHTTGGTAASDQSIRFSDASNLQSNMTEIAQIEPSDTTFTEVSREFVYDNDKYRYFGAKELNGDGSSGDGGLFMDTMYIKEVGVASGWTDADQQLDIPQTALQSYNQLAYFEGDNAGGSRITASSFTPSDITSVSMWVWLDAADGLSVGLFDCIDWSGGTNFRIFRKSGSDQISVGRMTGSETEAAETSTGTVRSGKWYHIVSVVPKDSSTGKVKIYINGKLDSTHTSIPTMPLSSRQLSFGYGGGLNQSYMDGCINEMAIYGDELTLAEIQELYNNGKAKDAREVGNNLRRYYKNEGLKTTWTDLGSDGSNATLAATDETLLIPAGVDSNRDTQGFLMNRKKTTNSLNLKTSEGLAVVSDNSPDAVIIQDSESFDHSDGSNSKLSISAWFKANSYGSLPQDQVIVSKGTSDGGKREWKLLLDDSSTTQLLFMGSSEGNGGSGNDLTYDLGNITDTNWHHIVVTYDGTAIAGNEVVAYLDGGSAIEVSHANAEAKINAEDGNVCIGDILLTNTGGDGFEFDGQIDDVCYYNRKILSATEAKRNYNAGKRSHK